MEDQTNKEVKSDAGNDSCHGKGPMSMCHMHYHWLRALLMIVVALIIFFIGVGVGSRSGRMMGRHFYGNNFYGRHGNQMMMRGWNNTGNNNWGTQNEQVPSMRFQGPNTVTAPNNAATSTKK